MPRITEFFVDDSELNVGPVALIADWLLAIEGDGSDFEITHAWIAGKRADDWEMSLAKHWLSRDLASKNSRVRREWRTAVDEAEDDAPRARADFERDMRLQAAE